MPAEASARGLGLGLVALALLGAPGRAMAAGPVGTLVVDCTGIEGWAQEPDMPDAFIDVHLYFNGPAGDPAASAIAVHAGEVLASGCMGAECMHGYRSELPMGVLDAGDHAVHAYGIDLTGDPNLEIGSGVLSCPPLPIVGGEKRHIVSPEILGAWQFSVFFDRLIVPDTTIASLPQAGSIDVGPQLRVDGTGGLWLVDAGFLREVPAEVAPAWRLDPAAAVALTPEEQALPEGTPLRPRPILLQGTMPEVYLLDDHQCGADDPHPDCVPDEGTTTDGGEPPADGSSSGEAPDGGTQGETGGGAGEDTGTGPSVPGATFGTEDDPAAEGCGCRSWGRSGSAWAWLAPWLAVLLARRRRGHGLPSHP
ncbi:hypothetical protein [Paraliomyxa miuraensis]|uniref:hypothetical protein n=1 Tax=Paraliomyxa miuraensis TaxID=376150 RepID=UPI00225507B9|nr:hypothetical protein [Paraliomyxa miuraensis]MCX4240224.1 hypothetical protein [Paraliomyxa miuraensis]